MSELKSVINVITMTQIPEMALIWGVERELRGRETFKDANPTHNERIYHGSIFKTLLEENAQLVETCSPFAIGDKKTLRQLAELAELIDTDYVMITLP